MLKRYYLMVIIFILVVPALCSAEPHAAADEHERDFGLVTAGEPLIHPFVLKNIGTTDLVIFKILSS